MPLSLAVFVLFYGMSRTPTPLEVRQGYGLIQVGDIQESKGFLNVKGTLLDWNGTPYNQPHTIRVHKSKEDAIAFHQYLLYSGTVKRPIKIQGASFSYISLPWIRFYAKRALQQKMEGNHPQGVILSALLFGTPLPKSVALSIKRFGLTHLFAISGFHFNLITSLLALLLRPFISYRLFHWAILSLLILYALLIGPNPSLIRGFLSQAILFLGLGLGKEANSINSLGVALGFITLFFPQLTANIGFIFSFIITLALLLLFPYVSRLFPPKPRWLMSPLALLCTVEMASFPLNLTLFGKYPLFSPLYNLCVTPLISFSLFMAPLTFIPYVADLVYLPLKIALWTFEIPPSLDSFLQWTLTPFWLIVYLTALFSAGILANGIDNLRKFRENNGTFWRS